MFHRPFHSGFGDFPKGLPQQASACEGTSKTDAARQGRGGPFFSGVWLHSLCLLRYCFSAKYINYINRCEQRKNTKIILLTLSPDTHRTSEENLGLAYLTAVLRRAGFFVEIIDAWLEGLNENEVYEKIINDEKIGIIGISCYMSNNDKSLALAKRIRKDNQYVKLICGEFGSSFNDEKILQNKAFDYVMIEEGEKSIVQLCNYVLGTQMHEKNISLV